MDITQAATLNRDSAGLSALERLSNRADGSTPAGPRFADVLNTAKSESLVPAQGAAANDGGLGSGRAGKAQLVDRSSELYEQCRELETFLMKTLLKEMRKTVPEGELGDNSFAGKMYRDMLDDEYAGSLSENAGFGLADMAYLELSGQRGKVSISV